MSATKVDVFWSPVHTDKLITFELITNELRFYQVEPIQPHPSGRINHRSAGTVLSDTTCAQLVTINSEVKFMKCMSCYPKPLRAEADVMLAVGQTSGKVIITSFFQPLPGGVVSDPISGLIGKEFVPKNSRQCNCVLWNPTECNLLAAGYEKHRTDYGTLVWDINKALDAQYQSLSFPAASSALNAGIRPVYELGIGETTYSLKWFTNQPKTMVCGMNSKHLKIFDLRSPAKPRSFTATKAVYGITLDPFSENRLASFAENTIAIWDTRNFDKPLISLTESKPVIKISWCATRSHLLASLTKDSSNIKLHDIQITPNNSGNYDDPTVLERFINPYGQPLSSFSWHPNAELRMIAIGTSGGLRDYTCNDRVTLNWSPQSEIIWTKGKKVLQCIDARDDLYKSLDDISVKMRKRASQGYGLDCSDVPDDLPPELQRLWKWIRLVKSFHNCVRFKAAGHEGNNKTLIGIRNIIGGQNQGEHQRSETNYAPWIGFEQGINSIAPLKVPLHKSDDRNKALYLCDWGSDLDGSSILKLIDNLEASGDFTRAAALAVFNLRIRRAILSLTEGAKAPVDKGGDPYYSTVAMALAGFTDKNSLWKEMCKSLRKQITDCHLKAIFTFLTCDNEHYEDILSDGKLRLADRVGFACTFLSDHKLFEFLASETTKMVKQGNLDGLLLTGVSEEGLELLERYIEKTSDVQTVSLVILQSLPCDVHEDPRAKSWVENYKSILDCWRLWHQRAYFDIEWYKRLSNESPPQQLFVSCNFCDKSVSSYLRLVGRSKQGLEAQQQQLQLQQQHQAQQHFQGKSSMSSSSNKTRTQSCPSCRKALPRCALCLTHLGTPAMHWRSAELRHIQQEPTSKLSPFNNWFTWCQSCRHGGHSQHLVTWFKEHVECPVSGCTCRCMTIDNVSRMGGAWDARE